MRIAIRSDSFINLTLIISPKSRLIRWYHLKFVICEIYILHSNVFTLILFQMKVLSYLGLTVLLLTLTTYGLDCWVTLKLVCSDVNHMMSCIVWSLIALCWHLMQEEVIGLTIIGPNNRKSFVICIMFLFKYLNILITT